MNAGIFGNCISKSQINTFCTILEIPEFVVPWLDRFFESEEIELILELNEQLQEDSVVERGPSRAQQIARKWPADFLTRCYRRAVISQDHDGNYQPADFHARYEIWALFEGWRDVPEDIITKLNQWELKDFFDTKEPKIKAFQKSGLRDRTVVWPEYVLLNEALAVIDRVPHVYLWPCNCRAMIRGCDKPTFVCLRFNNSRNLGWEISKEKAKEIVSDCNQKGLMQNAELGIKPDGSIQGAICNCCSDCCFPAQLSNQLDAKTLYPLSRYVARFTEEKCSTCGRCTQRCPYQAFTFSKKESASDQSAAKHIQYGSDLCRGCGLCSTTCPEEAIEMDPLDPSPLSIFSEITE
jgi:Pyruvate/2-oxoacid:ferredoxin oxidoreductase delta subunit